MSSDVHPIPASSITTWDHEADVVIAGRACDTAIFAAIPLMLGYPVGPSIHLSKIVECETIEVNVTSQLLGMRPRESLTTSRETKMTDAPSNPWPTELRLHKDRRTLTVAFDSGETFDLAAEYLRVRSPSAEVQGHSPDERKTVPGKP